jgi:hypothetical protein
VAALRLHDVDDAAKFVASIATRSGLKLSYHDREDLDQFLLVACWKLSLSYTPGGIPFSAWAVAALRLRVVDWQRQRFGRTVWQFSGRSYERKRPQLVSLDDPDHDRLGDAQPAGTSDPATGSDEACGGLLRDGDRARAWDYEALGLEPPRRAP